MLTEGIAASYRRGRGAAAGREGVRACLSSSADGRNAAADLLSVSGDTWLADRSLHEEVFGPFGILVRARDEAQLLEIAEGIAGQLTVTLQLDAEDEALGQRLMPVLERKAGRRIFQAPRSEVGGPGLEVGDRMDDRHDEAAVRPQHPRHLGDDARDVLDVHQHVVGNDEVEAAGGIAEPRSRAAATLSSTGSAAATQ